MQKKQQQSRVQQRKTEAELRLILLPSRIHASVVLGYFGKPSPILTHAGPVNMF